MLQNFLTCSREKPPGDFLLACGNRVYLGAKGISMESQNVESDES